MARWGTTRSSSSAWSSRTGVPPTRHNAAELLPGPAPLPPAPPALRSLRAMFKKRCLDAGVFCLLAWSMFIASELGYAPCPSSALSHLGSRFCARLRLPPRAFPSPTPLSMRVALPTRPFPRSFWALTSGGLHREDIAARGPEPTGPGSSSYAAGTDPEQAAESAKLLAGAHKVLGWVPVLGGLLGKAEQSQKRQGPQGV